MSEQPSKRSPWLLALGVVLAVESVAMIAAVGLLVWEQFAETPFSRASSIALLVLVVVATVLLVLLTRATWQRRKWIRGAAITWQVLQIAAAWVFVQGDLLPIVGGVAIALSLAGIVCAVHPATVASLERDDRLDDPAEVER